MSGTRSRFVLLATALIALATAAPATAAPSGTAPGAPGDRALWTPADKDGYGTSTTTASKVWHTLSDGELTEVFFPDLGTPSIRDTQLVVTDGSTFTDRERQDTTHAVELADPHSLTYRQVNTDREGKYRITKTYATDPNRHVLLVDVSFESLTGDPYTVYVLHDPALTNDGDDDTGTCTATEALTRDASTGSALVASPDFTTTSCAYKGAESFGAEYASAPNGNVVQIATTALDGVATKHLTFAIGFAGGGDQAAALSAARASLAAGFTATSAAYAAGWHTYLAGLKGTPASAAGLADTYEVSVMTLAAH